MIRFEDIGLRYGTGPEVLRGINFTLTPGSFHLVVSGLEPLLRCCPMAASYSKVALY